MVSLSLQVKLSLTIIKPETFRRYVKVSGIDADRWKDSKCVGELGNLHRELFVVRVGEVEHKVSRQLSIHAGTEEPSTHKGYVFQIRRVEILENMNDHLKINFTIIPLITANKRAISSPPSSRNANSFALIIFFSPPLEHR